MFYQAYCNKDKLKQNYLNKTIGHRHGCINYFHNIEKYYFTKIAKPAYVVIFSPVWVGI